MAVKWDVPHDKLNPQFYDDVNQLLAESPYSWVVTFGYRSIEEQRALYLKHLAGGPLAAPPGQSAHNWGLAIDCAVVLPSGKYSWGESGPEFPWLWEAVRQSPRMHSGHEFHDDDHVQSTGWLAKRIALKESGEWTKYL